MLCCALLLFLPFYAQTLSDSAQISLLTCEPGKQLYSAFGHTAIRVKDPMQHIDVVFNYGTFNFNTKGFYFKFVKGATDYMLSVDDFNSFIDEYERHNRGVYEQVLNLNGTEKQRLWVALVLNSMPENCYYRYNFVYDNCSTRPRVMIENALGEGHLRFPVRESSETYREIIGQYVGEDSWTKFGIDFLIGSEADEIIPSKGRMFLPLELMSYMQGAKKSDGSPVVSSETKILNCPEEKVNAVMISPLMVSLFFMCMVAGVCFYCKKSHHRCYWFDAILFSISGLMGCLIFFLDFISVHPLVTGNLNLLWLNPLHLIFPVLYKFHKYRQILGYFQMAFGFSILAAMICVAFGPQSFNMAFLPIMVSLLVRSGMYARSRKLLKFLRKKE